RGGLTNAFLITGMPLRHHWPSSPELRGIGVVERGGVEPAIAAVVEQQGTFGRAHHQLSDGADEQSVIAAFGGVDRDCRYCGDRSLDDGRGPTQLEFGC